MTSSDQPERLRSVDEDDDQIADEQDLREVLQEEPRQVTGVSDVTVPTTAWTKNRQISSGPQVELRSSAPTAIVRNTT